MLDTGGPRCAEWAREIAIDPVGSATAASGWLLVEWPLPWPRDASEIGALAPVLAALDGSAIRLQLLVPPGDAAEREVVLHRGLGDAWFDGYERVSVRVAPHDVVDAAADLLRGNDEPDLDPAVDVLVCGHGARDRCCGSFGTALALELAASGVAVRRTSHTGGHRFAPTGVVLPAGTMWAFLDADAARRVIGRSGPLDDLLARYRGSSAMSTPGLQALERVAFADIGWSWLDHRRRGTDLGGGRVRVEALAPDGTALAWEAEAVAGRDLPIPDCGRPVEAARKFEAEVVLREVSRPAS